MEWNEMKEMTGDEANITIDVGGRRVDIGSMFRQQVDAKYVIGFNIHSTHLMCDLL